MWQAILGLLSALPQILNLIENIQKMNLEADIQRKVKDDVEKINNVFESKDADALNAIFNDDRLSIEDTQADKV